MPTYAARCPDCEHSVEYTAKISERDNDATLPTCKRCGEKMVRGVIGNYGGFQLKGIGWFGPSKSGGGTKKE